MGRRGKKRDYDGRPGKVIRFVQSHPEWTYARVGKTFGLTRQAVGQLITTEEKVRGTRLHIRQNNGKIPHLDSCRLCQRAIKKLQEDPAQLTTDLYPGCVLSKRDYHLSRMKKAGVLEGAILFISKRRLMAYRAWRDGMPAIEIERRFRIRNWYSSLTQLEEQYPSRGRHKKRDLRPNWQKDLEGHDIKRLTAFILYGFGIIEKTGKRVPFHQSVHARSRRVAMENAEVTLPKVRGIRPITLKVKRWEKGDSSARRRTLG